MTSMRLTDYNAVERLIQPSRLRRMQTASKGCENKLRTVRINEDATKVLNDYLFIERLLVESAGGIVTDWMFLNLSSNSIGRWLTYHNYLKILGHIPDVLGLKEKKFIPAADEALKSWMY